MTLQFDVFDGETGQKAATSAPVTLSPGQWKQFNSVLTTWKLSSGYVRVTRTTGKAGWGAYAVLNDGSTPGAGTGDGSFVGMTPGP